MFRFQIRDLLWLMVVVALGVGWWVDHRRYEALRTLGLFGGSYESRKENLLFNRIAPAPNPPRD